MSKLSAEQRKSFEKVNALLGFGQGEYVFDMSHPAFQNLTVSISAGPDDGDITGKTIPIASFDDLFALLGLPKDVKNNLPEMSPVYPCEAMLITVNDLYIKEGQVVTIGQEDMPTVLVTDGITIETGG